MGAGLGRVWKEGDRRGEGYFRGWFRLGERLRVPVEVMWEVLVLVLGRLVEISQSCQ